MIATPFKKKNDLNLVASKPAVKTLDWEVMTEPLFTASGKQVDGWKRVFRSDNDKELHLFKNSYTPTQNALFTRLMQSISDNSGYAFEGFHEIRGGAKLFGYLKNPNPLTVNGNKMSEWLSVGNSHNGTSSFFVLTTTLLHRCDNQFSRAHKGLSLKFSHTKNSLDKINNIGQLFELYQGETEKVMNLFKIFGETAIQDKDKDAIINKIIGIKKGDKEITQRKKNLQIAMHNPMTMEVNDLGRNLWALFNGITKYTTHTKKGKDLAFGNTTGITAKYNQTAFDYCVQLAKRRNRLAFTNNPRLK